MSADNGIYIISSWRTFKGGDGVYENHQEKHKVYRVAHVQAIDNLDWYAINQPDNFGAYVYETWKNSPVFMTKEEAHITAGHILDDIDVCEYGIRDIDLDSLIGKEFYFYGEY